MIHSIISWQNKTIFLITTEVGFSDSSAVTCQHSHLWLVNCLFKESKNWLVNRQNTNEGRKKKALGVSMSQIAKKRPCTTVFPKEDAGTWRQKFYSCSEAKRKTWILMTEQIGLLIISLCSSAMTMNIHVELTAFFSYPPPLLKDLFNNVNIYIMQRDSIQ